MNAATFLGSDGSVSLGNVTSQSRGLSNPYKFMRWFVLGLSFSSVGTACKRATTRASANVQAPAETAGDWVVKVATEPDFPPFGFLGESGQLEGFDIDLMLAVGQVAGLDVQFKNLPFETLQFGTVDVAISAITITPERVETVDFARPYFKTGFRPSPLQELLEGNVDAVINDEPVTRYALATENITDIKIIDAFPAETFYGIALAKESKALATINSALETLITDGTYTDIYKKWFDSGPPSLPASAPLSRGHGVGVG